MKIQRLSAAVLLFFLCQACTPGFINKNISEYTIDNNALQDGDSVEVIYAPLSPGYNKNLDYYLHIIVVSKTTGDTVNVLTTDVSSLSREDRVRNFISFNSVAYKVFQHSQLETKYTNIDEIQPKIITTVKSCIENKDIEENHFPTAIGILGTVTEGAPKIE